MVEQSTRDATTMQDERVEIGTVDAVINGSDFSVRLHYFKFRVEAVGI